MPHETRGTRWSLHIFTVLALVPVLLAACFCNLGHKAFWLPARAFYLEDAKPLATGWPLRYKTFPKDEARAVRFFNTVWSVGIVVATAAVVERAMRKRQVQLRSAFFATAAVGVWLGVARYGVSFHDLKVHPESNVGDYAWWLEVPLGIGSCCLIYGFLRSAEVVSQAIAAALRRPTPP